MVEKILTNVVSAIVGGTYLLLINKLFFDR